MGRWFKRRFVLFGPKKGITQSKKIRNVLLSAAAGALTGGAGAALVGGSVAATAATTAATSALASATNGGKTVGVTYDSAAVDRVDAIMNPPPPPADDVEHKVAEPADEDDNKETEEDATEAELALEQFLRPGESWPPLGEWPSDKPFPRHLVPDIEDAQAEDDWGPKIRIPTSLTLPTAEDYLADNGRIPQYRLLPPPHHVAHELIGGPFSLSFSQTYGDGATVSASSTATTSRVRWFTLPPGIDFGAEAVMRRDSSLYIGLTASRENTSIAAGGFTSSTVHAGLYGSITRRLPDDEQRRSKILAGVGGTETNYIGYGVYATLKAEVRGDFLKMTTEVFVDGHQMRSELTELACTCGRTAAEVGLVMGGGGAVVVGVRAARVIATALRAIPAATSALAKVFSEFGIQIRAGAGAVIAAAPAAAPANETDGLPSDAAILDELSTELHRLSKEDAAAMGTLLCELAHKEEGEI